MIDSPATPPAAADVRLSSAILGQRRRNSAAAIAPRKTVTVSDMGDRNAIAIAVGDGTKRAYRERPSRVKIVPTTIPITAAGGPDFGSDARPPWTASAVAFQEIALVAGITSLPSL